MSWSVKSHAKHGQCLEDHVGIPHFRANSAQSSWISMTTALNAMSVPLNALRWPSLGHGDPSCRDAGFLLDASDTRFHKTNLHRAKRVHQPPHPQSRIDDLRTASAKCLVPEGSMCAVKTRRLTRLANCEASMYSATGRILVRSSRGADFTKG